MPIHRFHWWTVAIARLSFPSPPCRPTINPQCRHCHLSVVFWTTPPPVCRAAPSRKCSPTSRMISLLIHMNNEKKQKYKESFLSSFYIEGCNFHPLPLRWSLWYYKKAGHERVKRQWLRCVQGKPQSAAINQCLQIHIIKIFFCNAFSHLIFIIVIID